MDGDAWEQMYAESDDESPVDPQLPAVAGDLEPGTALDMGCGHGQNSMWLATRGWTVTGIDVSPTAIDRARRAATEAGLDVAFEVADTTSWSPTARYDLVISTFALPPAGDGRARALTSAAAAVDAGGTFFIAEFDRALAKDSHWTEDELIDVDEIVSYLDGFEVQRADVGTLPHTHGDHTQMMPVASVVARRLP